MKIGRNDPCHCGSGKKYKKCCERIDQMHSPLTIAGKHGMLTYTRAQKQEFESDQNIARHEAAHAIGHWIMRHAIDYMQLNDDRTDKANHGDTLAGLTVGGGRLPDIMALPIGERTVIALEHAFVTLAGPVGSGDAQSDNPLREHETIDHLYQAGSKLHHMAGMDADESRVQVARLLSVVANCFDDLVIQNMVDILATILLEKRRLEGNVITEILNRAYPVCKEAAEQRQIAVLSRIADEEMGATA